MQAPKLQFLVRALPAQEWRPLERLTLAGVVEVRSLGSRPGNG